MERILSIPVAVVLMAVLVAAVTDLWKFKVHNWLTIPFLVSGLIYHGMVEGGLTLLDSALGALFGFAILVVFYILGGMGAGDVKLMAGIGAWLGVPVTFAIFLAASLAAGVYALVVLLISGRTRETWINLQILWHRVYAISRHLGAEDRIESGVLQPDRRMRYIPFAAMMALGLIGILLWASNL